MSAKDERKPYPHHESALRNAGFIRQPKLRQRWFLPDESGVPILLRFTVPMRGNEAVEAPHEPPKGFKAFRDQNAPIHERFEPMGRLLVRASAC